MDWVAAHSYAAADVHGAMGCNQKKLYTSGGDTSSCLGPYPMVAYPEFHVRRRLELLNLPLYIPLWFMEYSCEKILIPGNNMAPSCSKHMFRSLLATSYGCCRSYSNTSTDTIESLCKIPLHTLQFDDHRTVFQHKNTWELLRALLVLRACGSNYLVDNSLKVSNTDTGLIFR